MKKKKKVETADSSATKNWVTSKFSSGKSTLNSGNNHIWH